jgi:hypothetical protein
MEAARSTRAPFHPTPPAPRRNQRRIRPPGHHLLRPLAGACALLLATTVQAVSPDLYVWLDRTGATGHPPFDYLPADVDSVEYSDGNVYVYAPGIPDYPIGPTWPSHSLPTNQHYLLRIPRHPEERLGPKIPTPPDHIGLFINGVPFFNAKDAHSWNDQRVWNQNAVVVEAGGADACLGHPTERGEYHHHQNPICLHSGDPTRHSPLLGYAFDGFPIYGPYGYANPDGSGGIIRMTSGYHLRDIDVRHTLPDGTELPDSLYGPDVGDEYPLGYYVEDFVWEPGTGIVDQYHGRFTVTPEYPDGIYAYFTAVDSSGASAYPYTIGPWYYGVPDMADFNVNQVTIDEEVMSYNPQPPAPFSLLTPADGDTVAPELTLRWRKASDPDPADTVSYVVYWSEASSFEEGDSIQVGQDTTYTFGSDVLSTSTLYHWKVDATDVYHLRRGSDPSTGWIFYVGEGDTPSLPSIEATAGEEGIVLSWRIPADVQAAGFRVYRRVVSPPGEESGSEWTCLATLLPTWDETIRFVDSEAERGVLYEYEVEVVGPGGPAGRWGPARGQLPETALFFRVHPNPARGNATTLAFGLPTRGTVALRVFDPEGQEVGGRVWRDLRAGSHEERCTLTGRRGRPLPSGAYWLRLETPAGTRQTRWTVLR